MSKRCATCMLWESGERRQERFHDALKGLPVNSKATDIYLNNLRIHDPTSPDLYDPPNICGTAVWFEDRVWS